MQHDERKQNPLQQLHASQVVASANALLQTNDKIQSTSACFQPSNLNFISQIAGGAIKL
jgi:hypothetical protein